MNSTGQLLPNKCEHNSVSFDEEAAKGMQPIEVARRWPRFFGKCSCGYEGIAYASYMHYIYLDG